MRTVAAAEEAAQDFVARVQARMEVDAQHEEGLATLLAAAEKDKVSCNSIFNAVQQKQWEAAQTNVESARAAKAYLKTPEYVAIREHSTGARAFVAAVRRKVPAKRMARDLNEQVQGLQTSVVDRKHGLALAKTILAQHEERSALLDEYDAALKEMDMALFAGHDRPVYRWSWHNRAPDSHSWYQLAVVPRDTIRTKADMQAVISKLKKIHDLRQQVWDEMLSEAKKRFGLESAEEVINLSGAPGMGHPYGLADKSFVHAVGADGSSKAAVVKDFLDKLEPHAKWHLLIKNNFPCPAVELLPLEMTFLQSVGVHHLEKVAKDIGPLHADAVLVRAAAQERQKALNKEFGLREDSTLLVSPDVVLRCWLMQRWPTHGDAGVDLAKRRTLGYMADPAKMVNDMPAGAAPADAVAAALSFLNTRNDPGKALKACVAAGLSKLQSEMIGKWAINALVLNQKLMKQALAAADGPDSQARLAELTQTISAPNIWRSLAPPPANKSGRCRGLPNCNHTPSLKCSRGCSAPCCELLTARGGIQPACPFHGQPEVAAQR